MGALKGIAAHRALRLILSSLVQAGCVSTKSPEAIQVMRRLGGFSLVVRRIVDEAILREERNPRAKAFVEAVRCRIGPIVAAVREEVQAILSTQPLAAATPVASGSSRSSVRKPLTQGSFPEQELSDASSGWTGIADLLNITTAGIEIVDFKTGEYDKAHELQVKLYSLIWARDTSLNPAGKLVTKLTLRYIGREVEVRPLSEKELTSFQRILDERAQAAKGALKGASPLAKPSAENCRYCFVRHLCATFWTQEVQERIQRETGDDERRMDIEVDLVSPHGPHSWQAKVRVSRLWPVESSVLVRLNEYPHELVSGQRLRILDAQIIGDEPNERVVVLHKTTELFLLS